MTGEKERSRSELSSAEKNTWGRIALRAVILIVAFVALVGFSVVLAKLTLTPSPASAGIAGSNLRPGHSLREYLDDYTFLAACKQVGGNLLLGVPFGLILPVLVSRRRRLIKVVVLTAVVMTLVELAQGTLVEGRAFDVDDVIMNTSGALIGYLLIGRRIGHRYHALADPPARRRVRPDAPDGTGEGQPGTSRKSGRTGFLRSAGLPGAGGRPDSGETKKVRRPAGTARATGSSARRSAGARTAKGGSSVATAATAKTSKARVESKPSRTRPAATRPSKSARGGSGASSATGRTGWLDRLWRRA